MNDSESTLDKIWETLLALFLVFGSVRAFQAYRDLSGLLVKLIEQINTEVSVEFKKRMRKLGFEDEEIEQYARAISTAGEVQRSFGQAISSLATELLAGAVPAVFGIFGRIAQLTPQQRLSVQNKIQSKTIALRAKNGRMYRYESRYYLKMLKHTAVMDAVSNAVIHSARNGAGDLVQISPQPSTIGDYCDAYRGQVFSVSGQSSSFPPLSITPQGGPPFHPWCHHYLLPITNERAASMKTVLPPGFASLGQRGANPREFQKLWLARHEAAAV